jgi:hypothetical protein
MIEPLATASGILRKGKETIELLGWRQGAAGWSPGLCAHDAIKNIGGQRACARAISIFSSTVAPEGRHTSTDLARWNDARGRTKEQVLAGFDLAIVAAEAQEAKS